MSRTKITAIFVTDERDPMMPDLMMQLLRDALSDFVRVRGGNRGRESTHEEIVHYVAQRYGQLGGMERIRKLEEVKLRLQLANSLSLERVQQDLISDDEEV